MFRLPPLLRAGGRPAAAARLLGRRLNSSAPKPAAATPPPAPPPKAAKAAARADSIVAKLPRRLQPYAQRFANRPVSHVVSFLVLHEITAVVPVVGLAWVFHTAQWTPPGMSGEWIAELAEKLGRYFRKKGWRTFNGDKGARLVFELAAAWAVVKLLLPLRIGFSLWATPWFARVCILPGTNLMKRLVPSGLRRKKTIA